MRNLDGWRLLEFWRSDLVVSRSSESVWVCGEALIDLFKNYHGVLEIVGGGPANTAKALARLGLAVSFIGGISSDERGYMIRKDMSGVDLRLAMTSRLPSALAVVDIDTLGIASYDFRLFGTATFDFHRYWLPAGTPAALHIGSLATIVQPGADELFYWAKGIDAPIVFDPNVRPAVASDRAIYRDSVDRWASISSIVKLSEDDLSWLGYQDVSHFFALGVSLVVLTCGETGLSGITPEGRVSVPGVKVDVIDTVGAGDTVGAVIVEGLVKYGLETLKEEKLFEVLSRAAKAAAITCTRAGAKPPTLSELDA